VKINHLATLLIATSATYAGRENWQQKIISLPLGFELERLDVGLLVVQLHVHLQIAVGALLAVLLGSI
jgi:hypothetical protein